MLSQQNFLFAVTRRLAFVDKPVTAIGHCARCQAFQDDFH